MQQLGWISKASWWVKEVNIKSDMVLFCLHNSLKKTKLEWWSKAQWCRGLKQGRIQVQKDSLREYFLGDGTVFLSDYGDGYMNLYMC